MQAVKAGILAGRVTEQDDGTPLVELPPGIDEETGEETERWATVTVTFPPILEHDVAASVEAIVKAATLGGSQLSSVIDGETVTRMLLTALGEQDIDEKIAVIYPPEEEMPGEEMPGEEMPGEEMPEEEPTEELPEPEAAVIEATIPEDDPHIGEEEEWAQMPEWMQAIRARANKALAELDRESLLRSQERFAKITDEEWDRAVKADEEKTEAARPE